MQRKVAIGASNDVYERQADQVANRVAGGGTVPQGSISPIAPAPASSVGQREAKPDDKKKDEKSAAPVQREARPEDTKKDPKSAGAQMQRQAKPEEKKKDEKPASAPVQKQAKPEEKKKEEKPAAAPVQKQAKPDEKKKDEKPASAPVQKQAKPDEKKKEEKPAAAPVQKQAKPDEKKKDEKPASAPVQKQAKPDEKKKDEKPAAAPVQKQAKPDEKKKDEKPASAPVQKQAKPDDKKKDEKPAAAQVQKQAKPDDKKKDEKAAAPVQREVKPEDKKKEEVPGTLPAQRAEKDEPAKEDSGSVQASSAGGGPAATPSMESVASQAVANKGSGEPLQPATRGTLESRMGTDLSDVRVHNDEGAQNAADALNARAFTHENDIWLGRGESQSDTRLMAHEATHVVQQTGSVHRQLVQRATPPSGGAGQQASSADGGDGSYSGKEGEVKKSGSSFALTIPQLKIPTFKTEKTPKTDLKLPKKTDEPRSDEQRDIWEKDVGSGKGIDDKLAKKLKDEKAPSLTKGGKPVFFTEIKGGNFYVIGNETTIKKRSLRPTWDKSGAFELYQVDHIHELQLGGSDKDIDNFWLLEAQANMSSGREIRAEKNKRIQTLLDAATGKAWKKTPDIDLARREYDITFQKVVGGLKVDGKPEKRWTRDEIKDQARQLDELKVLSKKEIDQRGLEGSPTKIVVYTNEAGGGMRQSTGWKEGEKEKAISWRYGKLFHADRLRYDKDAKKGSLHVDAFEGSKLIKKAQMDFDIQEMDAIEFGGFVSYASVKKGIAGKLEALGLSAIELPEGELTESGLVARGKLKPSIRPFDKLDVDIVFDGDNVYLSKVFSASDFNFPGPIKVTSANLELFAGTQGIGARGDASFEVERVGQGKISAGASFGEGLTIAGDFEFDTKLFDPAKVHVEYSKGKFSGEGTIGIKPGKVRGIKSATITASLADGAIDAKGSIVPDIPAVEQADLSLHYDEKSGLIISGDLQLKKDIPGIAGGSIHAEVTKKEDRYIVKASGEATPKIPGVSSKLVVSYDDGAFDASITAAYEKGMLKGSVTVGATNRPIDDSGKPGEAPPAKSDKITIYGGGSVTLRLAPWLQATAAIKFLPNGEVEVTGKIGLPSVLNIFDEKKLSKNIFKIGIDIPILGFSVLGHNVGIFLEIGGGLDLDAGIGPGQLQDVELSVTYNPAHEEDTLVHGHAALHIPAHAGLRLFVSAALGAGIPLVDAKAGIELGGSLGIEGALHAAVDVDWSPKKGLVLDANAEIYAEPKFKFDITGFVLVEVDLLFTTKTLYEKKWQLAAVEYGSGLRLGMKLPVHYEEGKPFNISLSDIQFEVPNIDAMATIKGLFNKII
ncbi:MAG TPA: DUF4157 domain-containing protein [Candidatus Dormibacteraeota bacterium]|nr:DUF4157 domain-containing protein [Candidatus Dormibacteraeota bacterium]